MVASAGTPCSSFLSGFGVVVSLGVELDGEQRSMVHVVVPGGVEQRSMVHLFWWGGETLNNWRSSSGQRGGGESPILSTYPSVAAEFSGAPCCWCSSAASSLPGADASTISFSFDPGTTPTGSAEEDSPVDGSSSTSSLSCSYA